MVAWVVGLAVQPLLNVTDFSQHRISKCLCYFGDCWCRVHRLYNIVVGMMNSTQILHYNTVVWMTVSRFQSPQHSALGCHWCLGWWDQMPGPLRERNNCSLVDTLRIQQIQNNNINNDTMHPSQSFVNIHDPKLFSRIGSVNSTAVLLWESSHLEV